MAERLVIGVFGSKGEATSVRRRLEEEGIPGREISERVLRDTAPLPTPMEPVLSTYGASPLDGFFGGDRQEAYSEVVESEQTLICVRTSSEAEAESVSAILKLYEPLRIDVQAPEN